MGKHAHFLQNNRGKGQTALLFVDKQAAANLTPAFKTGLLSPVLSNQFALLKQIYSKSMFTENYSHFTVCQDLKNQRSTQQLMKGWE